MGNRAVIAMRVEGVPKEYSPGIYLHNNGGRDSVEAFLEAAKRLNLRGDDYGLARLTQIITNFFGGTLSVGVGNVGKLDCDNGDNGTYWINGRFEIVEREYERLPEQDWIALEGMVKNIIQLNPQFTKKFHKENCDRYWQIG